MPASIYSRHAARRNQPQRAGWPGIPAPRSQPTSGIGEGLQELARESRDYVEKAAELSYRQQRIEIDGMINDEITAARIEHRQDPTQFRETALEAIARNTEGLPTRLTTDLHEAWGRTVNSNFTQLATTQADLELQESAQQMGKLTEDASNRMRNLVQAGETERAQEMLAELGEHLRLQAEENPHYSDTDAANHLQDMQDMVNVEILTKNGDPAFAAALADLSMKPWTDYMETVRTIGDLSDDARSEALRQLSIRKTFLGDYIRHQKEQNAEKADLLLGEWEEVEAKYLDADRLGNSADAADHNKRLLEIAEETVELEPGAAAVMKTKEIWAKDHYAVREDLAEVRQLARSGDTPDLLSWLKSASARMTEGQYKVALQGLRDEGLLATRSERRSAEVVLAEALEFQFQVLSSDNPAEVYASNPGLRAEMAQWDPVFKWQFDERAIKASHIASHRGIVKEALAKPGGWVDAIRAVREAQDTLQPYYFNDFYREVGPLISNATTTDQMTAQEIKSREYYDASIRFDDALIKGDHDGAAIAFEAMLTEGDALAELDPTQTGWVKNSILVADAKVKARQYTNRLINAAGDEATQVAVLQEIITSKSMTALEKEATLREVSRVNPAIGTIDAYKSSFAKATAWAQLDNARARVGRLDFGASHFELVEAESAVQDLAKLDPVDAAKLSANIRDSRNAMGHANKYINLYRFEGAEAANEYLASVNKGASEREMEYIREMTNDVEGALQRRANLLKVKVETSIEARDRFKGVPGKVQDFNEADLQVSDNIEQLAEFNDVEADAYRQRQVDAQPENTIISALISEFEKSSKDGNAFLERMLPGAEFNGEVVTQEMYQSMRDATKNLQYHMEIRETEQVDAIRVEIDKALEEAVAAARNGGPSRAGFTVKALVKQWQDASDDPQIASKTYPSLRDADALDDSHAARNGLHRAWEQGGTRAVQEFLDTNPADGLSPRAHRYFELEFDEHRERWGLGNSLRREEFAREVDLLTGVIVGQAEGGEQYQTRFDELAARLDRATQGTRPTLTKEEARDTLNNVRIQAEGISTANLIIAMGLPPDDAIGLAQEQLARGEPEGVITHQRVLRWAEDQKRQIATMTAKQIADTKDIVSRMMKREITWEEVPALLEGMEHLPEANRAEAMAAVQALRELLNNPQEAMLEADTVTVESFR